MNKREMLNNLQLQQENLALKHVMITKDIEVLIPQAQAEEEAERVEAEKKEGDKAEKERLGISE